MHSYISYTFSRQLEMMLFSTAPTYDLLVGNGNHLSLVHFEGTVSETVHSDTTGNVVGVDIHVK